MLDVPAAAAALSAGCSFVTPSRVPVPKHLPWRALTVKGSVSQEGLRRARTLPTGSALRAQSFLPSSPQALHLLHLPICSFDTCAQSCSG